MLLIVFSNSIVRGQKCGTPGLFATKSAQDPGILEKQKLLNERIQNWIQNHHDAANAPGDVLVPVVVHIVYESSKPVQNITDDQVRSQIEVLNQDFNRQNPDAWKTLSGFQSVAANCGIKFKLAVKDPNGNPSIGITHTATSVSNIGNFDNKLFFTDSGGIDIWNRNCYLNIYVCNMNGTSSFPNILGKTFSPSISTTYIDGCVIEYRAFGTYGTVVPQYNLGRTATHEVGHYFDLLHVWGDATCGNDQVSDTPVQSGPTIGCNYPNLHVSCSNGPDGDMYQNYMDYSDDSCMNLFSNGQKARMLACYSVYPRDSLNCCLAFGINDEFSGNEIRVFPNPASELFEIISIGSTITEFSIRLIDLVGKEIYFSDKNNFRNGAIKMDVRNFPKGIYFLNLISDKGFVCKKIIRN